MILGMSRSLLFICYLGYSVADHDNNIIIIYYASILSSTMGIILYVRWICIIAEYDNNIVPTLNTANT